jgi:hypothetical protein
MRRSIAIAGLCILGIAILPLMLMTGLATGQQSRPVLQPTGCPTNPVNTPAQPIGPDDFIELRRSECFGTCPTYTVRIQGSGQITWNGQKFVRVVGSNTASVEPEKARALIEKARTSGFWNLCADYRAPVDDPPTFYTTVRIANQQKRVSNHYNSAPTWLQGLEREIDDVANTRRWIQREL